MTGFNIKANNRKIHNRINEMITRLAECYNVITGIGGAVALVDYTGHKQHYASVYDAYRAKFGNFRM